MKKIKKIKGKCNHDKWIVFSTAILDGSIMLECHKCGVVGNVKKPPREE